MSVNKHLVELFYDVLSPYTYIAFEVLTRCSKKWENMDLQLKPVLIAGIMQGAANQPPAMVPLRGRYMGNDLNRISEFYKVPYQMPNDIMNAMLVKGSLKAQRLLTAVKQECPDFLEEVSRQVFHRIWVKDQDITEIESLNAACDAAGLSEEMTAKLLLMISKDEIKEALKTSTAAASKHGAFGLPTYVLHMNGKQTMLFGSDRMFLLAHYLGQPWPELGSKL